MEFCLLDAAGEKIPVHQTVSGQEGTHAVNARGEHGLVVFASYPGKAISRPQVSSKPK